MKKLLFLWSLLWVSAVGFAQTIVKSSLSSGGGSVQTADYYMVYALGELGVAEVSTATVNLSEGFVGPDIAQMVMDVEDYTYWEGVYMYPNPVREVTALHFPETGDYEIVIYDLTGKEIWRTTAEQSQTVQLSLGTLGAGTYIAGIRDHSRRRYAALKFVKL